LCSGSAGVYAATIGLPQTPRVRQTGLLLELPFPQHVGPRADVTEQVHKDPSAGREATEPHAFPRELIEMRRPLGLAAVGADAFDAPIIGHEP